MLNSLRTRLWLTYALLAGIVLVLVFSGLVLFFVRSPLLDRQSYVRLDVILTELVNRQPANTIRERRALFSILERAAAGLDVRVIFLDDQGSPLFDSGADSSAALVISPRLLQTDQGVMRDRQLNPWLYTRRSLPAGGHIIVASPRPPRLQAVQRFFGQDSLLTPFFQAAAVALGLSLLLAVGIARWVAGPLRKISGAAHDIAQRTTSGSTTDLQLALHVPVEGPREVEELALAFNDMSDQVLNSQRAQRDFIANVSHELKTPLTAIQGFAQALLDETANSPAQRKQAAQVIVDEAGRMERLVQDVLLLARFDAGTLSLQVSPHDICDLLERTVARFLPQAQTAEVTLLVNCGELPPVNLDGDRIIQVFSNLIDNALRFSPAGGQIRVTAVLESEGIDIRFSDQGPGIPPADQPRIFERFYQVDKSRRADGGRGAGLGLAIAREIVVAHGGQLSVEPVPAQGTCFVVKLPFAATAEPGRVPISAR